MLKLQNLKGFRDFLPVEKRKRDFVYNKIIQTFQLFGFEPLETPTLEYAELLLGKYGEEADKLVYQFTDRGDRKIALRYDQTVPSARILTQYQKELPKFFRRYQIQNVFRAEKPQKGRYREFTQCDIDIFDSESPISDAEILACTYFAFKNVGFPNVIIKINDRQILFDNLKSYTKKDLSIFSIIQSLDKLDKISEKEVIEELQKKGMLKEEAIEALEKIQKAKITQSLKEIIDNAISLGIPEKDIEYLPSLARGLDYYTGMIFEIIIPEYKVGSFAGGGRYDNLIGKISGQEMKAVGVAFGFDRIVEGADSLGLISEGKEQTRALVTVFDNTTIKESLILTKELRNVNIKTEIYPSLDKLDKQLKLADRKEIPIVLILGPEEIKENQVTIKWMNQKKQETVKKDEAIERIKA